MAWPTSPGALRGRAERVVHGSGAVAAGPVAQDAAGVVFVRAPHRRDRYRPVSARSLQALAPGGLGSLPGLGAPPEDPPPASIRDPAQLLDVDVQELACCIDGA